MAKQRHQQPEPTSSRNAMIVLAVGGLLVAGLVVWALTRTVEPATTAAVDSAPALDLPAPTQTGTPPGAFPTSTALTTGTQPPAAPQIPGDRQEVARTSVEDLRAKLNRGEVTVVDVRDAASYQRGHIPGSINIPLSSTESMLDLLPKGKPIVTYCA